MNKKNMKDCLDKVKRFYNLDCIKDGIEDFLENYDKPFLQKALTNIAYNFEDKIFTYENERYVYDIEFEPEKFYIHFTKKDKKYCEHKNELICNFSFFVVQYEYVLNIFEKNNRLNFASFIASPYIYINQCSHENNVKNLVSQSGETDIMQCNFDFKMKRMEAFYSSSNLVNISKHDVYIGKAGKCIEPILHGNSVIYSNSEFYELNTETNQPESRDRIVSLFADFPFARIELLKEKTSTKLIKDFYQEVVLYNLDGDSKFIKYYGDITKKKNEMRFIQNKCKNLKYSINFDKIKDSEIYKAQM